MKSFKLVMEGRVPEALAEDLGTAVLDVLSLYKAEVTNAGIECDGREFALVGDMPRAAGTAPAVPTELERVSGKLDKLLGFFERQVAPEPPSPAVVTPPKKRRGGAVTPPAPEPAPSGEEGKPADAPVPVADPPAETSEPTEGVEEPGSAPDAPGPVEGGAD